MRCAHSEFYGACGGPNAKRQTSNAKLQTTEARALLLRLAFGVWRLAFDVWPRAAASAFTEKA